MKALVGTFNTKKALVEAFSVIVKTDCEIDGSSSATALVVILTGDSLLLSCSASTRVEAWRWVARRADCRSTALDLELSIVTG